MTAEQWENFMEMKSRNDAAYAARADVHSSPDTPSATALMGREGVQFVDIRLFFECNDSHDSILDDVQKAIEDANEGGGLNNNFISGYEIENDGFGNLTAAEHPFV